MVVYHNDNNGQAAITGALGRWYQRALHRQLGYGAWLQLHQNGALLYNCGGVNNGGDYGVDYVDANLYAWLAQHLPQGWAFAGGPTARWGGNVDANGNPQYTRDYYTITRPAGQAHLPQGYGAQIPAGNYNLVVNFHLYVDGWQQNPHYVAPPPPPPPAAAPPPLNVNDLNQFPPLG